jgi:NAD(P)-dependent dehydrogenase (short-subunit alcohol dehydrogenase family)
VNSVAPGAALWPEGIDVPRKERLLARIPLGRRGRPEDVAAAVEFLLDADYVTGQILAVDGGRLLEP